MSEVPLYAAVERTSRRMAGPRTRTQFSLRYAGEYGTHETVKARFWPWL